ncbi:LuxR C-terminal-related transcriptional regulator [Rhodococcus sp. H29-C3]|uniref:LuxR C-terminal-related transcriptional regulator n=1 Tax=Rhodococcus sp. H29-C3 TaxID=3046307 RepID=UPI0024B9A7AE|nr:LuxR C-terminal-related transcriptional regulator [Rhodococcus sp. H29-C3]MDJ0362543.1 LuxR C-terminal-related transcriptional regulator [Rhodococcus sp. H29-C3]
MKIGVVIDHAVLLGYVLSAIQETRPLIAVHSHSARHLPSDIHLLVMEYTNERTSLSDQPDHLRILLEVSATGRVARIEATDTVPRATTKLVWDLGHRIHALSNGCIDSPVPSNRTNRGQFSQRERDVLAGLAAGLTRREIARNLGISIHTVDTYKYRVKEKARAETMADLVRTAIELEDAS